MELLTFAHRGEAKAFLKNDLFSPVPFLFEGLYKNEKRLLLIHGEGSQSASEKLSVVCGAFQKEIHAVINLGVCGSLAENSFKIGETYPIRTCYMEGEFKSFSTHSKNGVDIITSKNRVKNLENAKNLSFFAPLVDREAWAVGSVCHLLNLPFYSFKMVSDYSNNEDICQLVSSNSNEISESLYNYFLKVKIEDSILKDEEKNNLWATTSQRRLFNSLSKKMELKGIKFDPSKFDSENLTPKKRMAKILEELEKNLFPFETDLKEKLEALTKGLRDSKIDVKFSKDFEDSSVLLSLKIQSQKELENIICSLNSFPFKNIKDLLDGRIDV